MRWLAIIIVAIIIVIAVAAPEISRANSLLCGMWVGDPAFLKKADLSDMQLFIAPGRTCTRDGYLIMTDTAGRFVFNSSIRVSYSFGWFPKNMYRALMSNFKQQICGRICFELDENTSPPFPEKLKFTLSLADSSLTLFGDKVFAFLHKDAIASNAAKETYEKS